MPSHQFCAQKSKLNDSEQHIFGWFFTNSGIELLTSERNLRPRIIRKISKIELNTPCKMVELKLCKFFHSFLFTVFHTVYTFFLAHPLYFYIIIGKLLTTKKLTIDLNYLLPSITRI